MQICGRSYENGEPLRVTIENRRITRVEPAWPTDDSSAWPWIAPGMFDLQINGHGGTWFSKESLTADDVISTLEPHFQYGITRMCPTLVTNSYEALAGGFNAIREACEREDWVDRMVPGCHLEGPYISREDGPRGAHPLSQVRAADWDEFQRLQEASGNRIRLVTLAPEAGNAVDFIRRAVESGVVISIGHTGATPEQVQDAVAAGAQLSTHLGNGAHGQIRRHPNYIWEQLGTTDLMASLITDGFHLPPSVVRSMIGAKGVFRTIITCDASGLAGCPPGKYREGEMAVEILEDGRLVLAGQDQLLAGSGVETDTCVAKAIEFAGLSLREALDMAGRNPSRLLRFEEPRLRRGSLADVILFHWDGPGSPLEMVATVAQGDLRYGEIPELALA
ncbi:MAG: amidohydrolase family protein [Planctomycetaceae bacterium]|nr:amidohydrolase family protein [Planctomycetaceae bacterium]